MMMYGTLINFEGPEMIGRMKKALVFALHKRGRQSTKLPAADKMISTSTKFTKSKSAHVKQHVPLMLGYDAKLSCPSGKVYEEIAGKKRCLTPCAPELMRNPKTRRCVKSLKRSRDNPVKQCNDGYDQYGSKCLKTCANNQVRNKSTNRCKRKIASK